MALPNPGMDAVPFTPLTAEFLDDMIENIESLSDGTGFENGAITTNTLADNGVTADKLNLGAVYDTVATVQTTTSTTYTDLATVGPSVTVTVGQSGNLLVIMSTRMSNSTDGGYASASFVMSGANTIAAGSPHRMYMQTVASGRPEDRRSYAKLFTGLNPGSTTITMKYSSITAGTSTYDSREISAIPL